MNLSPQVVPAIATVTQPASVATSGAGSAGSSVESGMFASVMAAQGSISKSPAAATTDQGNPASNSLQSGLQGTAASGTQSRIDVSGVNPAKPIAAPRHEALEVNPDPSNASQLVGSDSAADAMNAHQLLGAVPASDSKSASQSVSSTPVADSTLPGSSSTSAVPQGKESIDSKASGASISTVGGEKSSPVPVSAAADGTAKAAQASQQPVVNDSGLLPKQKVVTSSLQEQKVPVAGTSVQESETPNANLKVTDDNKTDQTSESAKISQEEVSVPVKSAPASVKATYTQPSKLEGKRGAAESDLSTAVPIQKAKPSQMNAPVESEVGDEASDSDVSEVKDTKKVAAPHSSSVMDPQMVQPGLLPVAVVPVNTKPVSDAAGPVDTNNVASAVAVAPAKETVVTAYQQLSGAAAVAPHAVKRNAAPGSKNNIDLQAKDTAITADETADENGDVSEIEVAGPSSTRLMPAGQKAQSGQSVAVANSAVPATSAQSSEPAVPVASGKDSASKVKGRSRDTGLSGTTADQDASKTGGSIDGLQVAQTQMPVDTSAVPLHAVNAPAGGAVVSSKEPGVFATATAGSASRSIDSMTGASFTSAQNLTVDSAMPGGRQQVEVGFHDSTLGWLSVRATAATDGGLHLSMAGRTNETAAAVDRMMPSLQHFLQDHDVRAHTVSYARQEGTVVPVATSAMATSAFSANSSNTSQGDRNGAGMGQQRSNSGNDSSELSQRGRNSQERAGPIRASSRYEGLVEEQGLLSIRI